MRFKSKRKPRQVCFVNKNAFRIKDKKLFIRRVKESVSFKENVDNFEHGTLTIVRERGRYYMCFPLKRKIQNLKTPYKSVALDPGAFLERILFSVLKNFSGFPSLIINKNGYFNTTIFNSIFYYINITSDI